MVPRDERLYDTTRGPAGSTGSIHAGVASFGMVAPDICSSGAFNRGATHQGVVASSHTGVASAAAHREYPLLIPSETTIATLA